MDGGVSDGRGCVARPHALNQGPCNQNITTYRFIDMSEAAGLLRLLGDETRLRLLRVLSRDALNVSELTGLLGLAQSGVSRHLGLLRDAGLIVEERAGTFTWYRLSPSIPEEGGEHEGLWRWLRAEFDRRTPESRADDARLEEIRRLRKENFSQHGGGDERRDRKSVV